MVLLVCRCHWPATCVQNRQLEEKRFVPRSRREEILNLKLHMLEFSDRQANDKAPPGPTPALQLWNPTLRRTLPLPPFCLHVTVAVEGWCHRPSRCLPLPDVCQPRLPAPHTVACSIK